VGCFAKLPINATESTTSTKLSDPDSANASKGLRSFSTTMEARAWRVGTSVRAGLRRQAWEAEPVAWEEERASNMLNADGAGGSSLSLCGP